MALFSLVFPDPNPDPDPNPSPNLNPNPNPDPNPNRSAIPNPNPNQVALFGLVFLPPLVVAESDPSLFFTALDYAGASGTLSPRPWP